MVNRKVELISQIEHFAENGRSHFRPMISNIELSIRVTLDDSFIGPEDYG